MSKSNTICDCNVLVFDFDGVIVEPVSLYEWDPSNIVPRPLGLTLLTRALDVGVVYIVSGRSISWENYLKKFLKENGISIRNIHFCLRESPLGELDHKLKCSLSLLEREGCILEWHDDNRYVLDSIRKRVCGGLVLHYSDKCEIIYGKSIFEQFCNRV